VATRTWVGDSSSNYNLVQNWDPDGVPQTADTALFTDLALVFDVTFNGSIHTGGWSFTGDNNDYTFSLNQNLHFTGAGIDISGDAEVMITVEDVNGIGWLKFLGSSSADTAKIEVFEYLDFEDSSTAANAVIINHGQDGSGIGYDDSIKFLDLSTAANATINNNDGKVMFGGNAKAGNARIESLSVDHGSGDFRAGSVHFTQNSTAENAILINGAQHPNAILDTPVILFQNAATAANAQITNDGILSFNVDSTAGDATIVSGAAAGEDASISFSGTADAGTSDITSHGRLTFGAESSAANAQIINSHTLSFSNSSTAGSATIQTNANPGSFLDGLNFRDSSRAGNATITGSGDMRFTDASTAANGTFTTTGAIWLHDTASGGNGDFTVADFLGFIGTSSAGSAEIDVLNGGRARFAVSSTGANALINVAGGGTAEFAQNATGGNARLVAAALGKVDFSQSNGLANNGKISAGSIAGAGSYPLGDNELTVGGNSLSTAVSGVISGTGSSLVKVGGGTLTLSGANTYTGLTTVKDGALALTGSAATTQSSGLAIDAGATVNVTALIFAGTGVDAVVNKGTISGLVRLGGGNDSFNGTGGSLAKVFGETGNDTLVGGSANDMLDGGADNDTLNGGAGADTLTGGLGNDIYVLANGSDVVSDAGGVDTASSTTTRSLAGGGLAKVENLTLLGVAAVSGTGNGLANVISGNGAANTLDGAAGNDTLSGGAGADKLIGGLGKDTMTGGASNDLFRFAALSHSAATAAGADVIKDFDDSGDDRIDVSTLFGVVMTYRHNLAFTKTGQVRINDIAGADLLVEVNTGGTLAADFAVRLTGTTLASMSSGDFVL
jgi:autotransporter-associated beta strand protein